MGGLLLCGKTAKKPLYVAEADINIYSMEELCYYMYNNVYMIGPEFFDNNLIAFIENEMELEKVAKKLRDERYRNESYINMIKTVLEGSDYYSEAERENILKVFTDMENKSPAQKMKARADMLAERGRLISALNIYKECVEKKNKYSGDTALEAMVKNNMGVIYAKLFMKEEALACFEQAWELQGEKEYMDNLICMAVILDSSEAYDRLKERFDVTEDIAGRYKQAVELGKKEVRESDSVRELMLKLTYNGEMELSEFYDNADRIIDKWKKEYREQIQ